jgi:hypothetical protein
MISELDLRVEEKMATIEKIPMSVRGWRVGELSLAIIPSNQRENYVGRS